MSGQWLARKTSPGIVHTVPLDDRIVHEHDTTCPCGPTEQPQPPYGSVWVHHSLDGREFSEPDGPA